MTMFDERERAHESRFAHDQDKEFRITNRRNKLLGLWVAAEIGKIADEAEAFAKTVVAADFAEPGDADVIAFVLQALTEAGKQYSENDIVKKLHQFEAQAREQIEKGV